MPSFHIQDKLETPEGKEELSNSLADLWAKVYGDSFAKHQSHSRASKDANKAIKNYKERF